jgi:hypothetical protein
LKDAAVTCAEINGGIAIDIDDGYLQSAGHLNICGNCDEAGPPPFFCKNCNAALCVQCKELHSTQKMFQSHCMIPRGDHFTCRTHSNEDLKFKCSCNKMICTTCAVTSHEEHQKMTIKEAADKHRSNLVALSSQQVKRLKSIQKEAMRGVEENSVQMTEAHDFIDSVARDIAEDLEQQVSLLGNNLFFCIFSAASL